MLAAHLAPGYFIAATSQSHWKAEWNRVQKFWLWTVAFGSTIAPDFDVIINLCFRQTFRHQILWTHSVFVSLAFGCIWGIFTTIQRCPYIRTMLGFIALGGLSHIGLDFIAHGTPLLYPLSMVGFEMAPQRVVQGGLLAYLTEPIFLLEPLLIGTAAIHAVYYWKITLRRRRTFIFVTVSGVLVFVSVFGFFLPALQSVVLPLLPK